MVGEHCTYARKPSRHMVVIFSTAVGHWSRPSMRKTSEDEPVDLYFKRLPSRSTPRRKEQARRREEVCSGRVSLLVERVERGASTTLARRP